MIYVYSFLFIVGFLIVISIPFAIISRKMKNKNLEKVFDGRQELNERDFYERYFESQGVPFFIIMKIREILEDVLDADLSRLSAEDDFSKNLNFFWQEDPLADVEMFEKIEEEFQIKFHQSDFDNLETTSVNDIVNIVWRKVREKNEFSNH
jgi:acyl carrier protein